MISFLEGTIEYTGDSFVIVNTGGIGYKVTLVPKLLSSISKINREGKGTDSNLEAKKVRFFVHSQMNMREGRFDMYGFDTRGDLDLFNMLISVTGIGPKNAMNILSTIEPQHLKAAVAKDDAQYLRKVSGLGAKTASRLVLELKNKIEFLEIAGEAPIDLGQEGHAIDALVSLGYSQTQAKEALAGVATTQDLSTRVREALKLLGKR